MAHEAAEELYAAISSFVNGYRCYTEDVGKELIRDHPLLQAYVVGLMLDMIQAMAEHDYVTPQNEAAVELCKKIMDAVGEYPRHL